MKKLLALLLCVLLLCAAGTALAAEYNPGDTVTVTISISNTTQAGCQITVNAQNDSVLIFQSAKVTMSGLGVSMAPIVDGAFFSLLSADYSSIMPTGTVGTVTYKIADNAPAGNYTITVSGSNCSASGSTTVKVVIPPCAEGTDKWDEGTVTTKPTCQAAGEKTYTCTVCGKTKTETVAQLNHNSNKEEVVLEPTCTEAGKKEFYCTNGCGAKQGEEAIAALGHDESGNWTVITPAGCETEGTEVKYCKREGCSDVIATRAIAANGHTAGEATVTKKPTCTATGLQSYNCTVCGQSISDETIDALGHDYVKSGYVAPTCTETGLTAKQECSRCDAVIAQETIAALGHNMVTDAAVAPTCTKTGLTEGSHCSRCDEKVAQQVVDALGHDYVGTVTKEPTCTDKGTMKYTCSRCSKYYTESIAALGHDWDEGVVSKEPTCTKTGVKTYTCQHNNAHTKTGTLAALGHTSDEGTVTVEPTCTTKGKKVYKCTVCAATLKTETLAALGHTASEDAVRVEPTCTTDGSISYNCTVCGAAVSGQKLTKLGHDWDEGVVTTEPTCTKNGVKTFTCQHDNSHTKTTTIKATGTHIWDDGVVTKEPTCTKTGTKTYTCTYEGCTKTKTETIKALGHTASEDAVRVEPTCTTDGSVSYNCTVCGAAVSGQKLTKLGHDWDEGVVTTQPTCTEAGVKTYTCQNDASHTKTAKVAALGHTWQTTKPVTKEEDGERQCTVCGKTEVISHIADYYMTVCSKGIRFRDLENPVTNKWYMFTPVDLSVEGEQTFDLIAGNMHVIGTVTVLVQDGQVTVTYAVNNDYTIDVYEEFMTILPSLEAVTELDFDQMTAYNFGEAISIEETLGGDTNVLLLLCNNAMYEKNAYGVKPFEANSDEYKAYVEELKQVMLGKPETEEAPAEAN